MAKDNSNKVLNAPPLRFPEFTESWEKHSLGELGETLIGLTYSPSDVVSEGGTIVFRSSNIKDGMIDYQDLVRVNTSIKERIVTRDGDILICARNGSPRLIGKNALLHKGDTNHTFGAFMMVYRSSEGKFVHPLLSTRRYTSQIGENMGARINQITTSDLNSFEFFFPPQKGERKKIGDMFELLNERIAIQNKVIEDLKRLKSAITDLVFCLPDEPTPSKRLGGFSNEWKVVRLSDICKRIRTKNTGERCQLVLTIAAQHGLVGQEDFFNKSVASDNLEGYYLLQRGDFAYNKSYSGDYTWGAVKRLERYEQGVLSPLYICFRPDLSTVNAEYLSHYFESKKWHKGVADIAGEGARNHGLLNISVVDYFNTLHRLPSLEEQREIAKCLNFMQEKLKLEQNILNQFLIQHHYLLRQMFI